MTLDLSFSLSVSYYSFIYLHPHSFVISVFILSAQSSVITLIHRSLFLGGKLCGQCRRGNCLSMSTVNYIFGLVFPFAANGEVFISTP